MRRFKCTLTVASLLWVSWFVFSVPIRPVSAFPAGQNPGEVELVLPLRTRVEAFKGSNEFVEVLFRRSFPVHQTAILICDMWDNHWCTGAARRVNNLVQKMAPFIDEAREHGIQIIHSPSDTMDFYRDTPWRKAIAEIPQVMPPAGRGLTDPPLPIDDSDGGCDTEGDQPHRAWSRQHPALRITGGDVISDKGSEIYSFLQRRQISNLLVMGVHTNMCILNRSFAIRQMTNWGINCVLVRDLTDAMYDPEDGPGVSHEQGTELVIQHIEKFWCPSVLSGEILAGMKTPG